MVEFFDVSPEKDGASPSVKFLDQRTMNDGCMSTKTSKGIERQTFHLKIKS